MMMILTKYATLIILAATFALAQIPATAPQTAPEKPIAKEKREEIATLIIRLQASRLSSVRIRDEFQQAQAATAQIEQALEKVLAEARAIDKVAADCVPSAERTWQCPPAKAPAK